MEAQDAGSTHTTMIAKGIGREEKEIGKHDRQGLGRSRCNNLQYHSFVFGR